jgi:AGZA family xanthine/uracil permease-like MFS transporter
MLEKLFKLKEHATTPRRELVGGITTFMTMAYILIVNPAVLSATGMDKDAVFTATALSALVGCLMMGLYANLPVALAPGMGLNAFFAYTVCIQMGYSWEMALAAVFIEGIIFILLTLFNVRDAIVNAIPKTMKLSISVGIGLFITTVGLVNSGIVVQGNAFSKLGDITDPHVYLTLIAILITGALLIKQVKGALLIGIIITTIIGIPAGIVDLGESFRVFSLPPSMEPVFMKMDFSRFFSMDMVVIVLTFIFMDLFDTAGTLIAVCTKSGLVDKDGNVQNSNQAFLSDAVATTLGAVLGTSTVTSFVESASGVAAGGRTGLTAIVTGVLFFLSLFFAPLFSIVPAAATSAALIIVGLFMITLVSSIDFEEYKTAIPAFVTIIITPLSYSIADGIIFGVLTYVGVHMFIGEFKKVGLPMYILAFVFLCKLIFL